MYPQPIDHANSPVRSPWRVVVAACMAVVFAGHGAAQAPAAGAGAPPPSTAQLDTLVGPIALYPDDLVAIILPAATNPLQIVQADRFLDKRKTDPKLPVDTKWDDAVKALVNYPDVVKMMSGDLDWTSALGEAVVADQGAVLEAIQSFRRRAQAVGNLKTDTKQVVEVEKEIIKIVPANPEVIYVPQYNPTTIVVAGGYPWGYWPTPYPVYYYPYPPGAAFATGLIWGAAIGAAWNGGRYATHYGANGNININTGNINVNRNVNTGNINTGNINRSGGATTLPAQGSSTAWKSDKRPGQVSSTTGRAAPTTRVGDASAAGGAGAARASTQPTGSLGGTAGQGAAARDRAGSASASQRAGSVSASPRDSFGGAGGSAMSGYGSGRQTQMDSSRGAASRSSMSSGASRSMSGGGGARGGGGGGGRGGGGRR